MVITTICNCTIQIFFTSINIYRAIFERKIIINKKNISNN